MPLSTARSCSCSISRWHSSIWAWKSCSRVSTRTGGHIYSVQNPGRPELLNDIIGYAANGSGTIHALQSMIGLGHSPEAEYHTTVFRVYASKRRAEVAPGVGADTDLAVIS